MWGPGEPCGAGQRALGFHHPATGVWGGCRPCLSLNCLILKEELGSLPC